MKDLIFFSQGTAYRSHKKGPPFCGGPLVLKLPVLSNLFLVSPAADEVHAEKTGAKEQ